MIDFRLPVDLPAIDLSNALPLLTLIILAALILLTLLARSIVRSRLIVIALIVALVMGGSSVIVGGLQALTGLLAVAGVLVIALLALIARHPELGQLARDTLETRRERTPLRWPSMIDQYVPPQLPASSIAALPSARRMRSRRLPKSMGF